MDEQFKPLTATPLVDPTKHVNYTYGMVLGVDDFTQEFVYHSERDQWMTRDLDGYGTVSGLSVTLAENAGGEQEVIVSAGTAVNPRGQLICVPTPQCAVIDRWLAVAANHKAAAAAAAELPPGDPLGIYVVLCYRDCPVDKLPVPGEPCRSEDEMIANSRLKDDFRLELRLAPPAQTEELAVREFVRWLRGHVEFTDDGAEFADLDSLAEAVRAAAEAAYESSPPGYVDDSPQYVLSVPSELRCDFLRAVFRIWVTELRPRFRPDLPGSHCSCAGDAHDHAAHGGGDEDCVLLAELRVHLTPDVLLDETQDVRVVEAQRPLLVHQRMLQEWLMCGSCCEAVPPPPPPPPVPALDELSDVDAPAPQENYLLTFSGGQWIAAPPPAAGGGGPPINAGGDLAGYYPDPTVAGLQGRGVNATEPNTGQVLTWDGKEWAPADVPTDPVAVMHVGDAAGGDLTGNYPAPTVAALQQRAVGDIDPSDGDVLTWDEKAGHWRPSAPPAPVSETLISELVTVTRRAGEKVAYRLWFHLDPEDKDIDIVAFRENSAWAEVVFDGNDGDEAASTKVIDIRELMWKTNLRNAYGFEVGGEISSVTFTFDLAQIGLSRVVPPDEDQLFDGKRTDVLSEYARRHGIQYVGQRGSVVTVYASFAPAPVQGWYTEERK